MQKAEKIIDEMEDLLDSLVESAKQLLALSQHVIEEDELVRLQEEQESLLASLVQKDEEFHKLPKLTQDSLMPRRLKIDEKIDHFQKLNASFVENINASHGLIRFDNGKKQK
jgi:hypothetical protein